MKPILKLASLLVAVASAHGSGPAAAQERSAEPHRFEDVVTMARKRAAAAYQPPSASIPDPLAQMDYDAYRRIRFKPESAFLKGTNFRLQLFHPGFLFTDPVSVHLVTQDGAGREIPFDKSDFDYGGQGLAAALTPGLGFAGLRLHYPLNDPARFDELAVFQGASYFRLLGRGQRYGLSARGLAIDTAAPAGEQFPAFRAFWIVTPPGTAHRIELHALLDSPSVAGAYRFEIAPGAPTVTDVHAVLFFRRAAGKLGLAPLTSMFLHGEMKLRRFDDFRPEVHDSDGLMVHSGAGEWIWRPLTNPVRLAVSAFVDENPRGFGLLQRDRAFSNYQDLEAAYERRASYWVEPLGPWGAGHIELVEIPTPDETNDNIVAFWVPDESPAPGAPFELRYRLTAALDLSDLHPGGKAVATWQTTPQIPGTQASLPARARRFIVDFAGGPLDYFVKAPDGVEAIASSSRGRIVRAFVTANEEVAGLRAIFDFVPEPGRDTDLRLFLRSADGRALTETWTLRWPGADE